MFCLSPTVFSPRRPTGGSGIKGKRRLQERFASKDRAERFDRTQVLDRLNERMRLFIARQEMAFIATADARGKCHGSFRAGPPGFVRVLDDRRLAYPEYRGNGVMESLGNILENPHIGLFFADFFKSTIGLHVNGRAEIVENDEMLHRSDRAADVADVAEDAGRTDGRRPERWVVVTVEEAYIHCSKHIPLLARCEKAIRWGTDDTEAKGGDYFSVRKGTPRDEAE